MPLSLEVIEETLAQWEDGTLEPVTVGTSNYNRGEHIRCASLVGEHALAGSMMEDGCVREDWHDDGSCGNNFVMTVPGDTDAPKVELQSTSPSLDEGPALGWVDDLLNDRECNTTDSNVMDSVSAAEQSVGRSVPEHLELEDEPKLHTRQGDPGGGIIIVVGTPELSAEGLVKEQECTDDSAIWRRESTKRTDTFRKRVGPQWKVLTLYQDFFPRVHSGTIRDHMSGPCIYIRDRTTIT